MKQYNYYGCSHCLQSGKQLTLDTGGTGHTFKVILLGQDVQDNKQEDMHEAMTMDKPTFGVKGPSCRQFPVTASLMETLLSICTVCCLVSQRCYYKLVV